MANKKMHPLATAGTVLPLAIGLAMNSFAPSRTPAPATERSGATSHKTKACVANLDACPITGCAGTNDPDEQLLNQTKRHVPSSSVAKVLTLADFTTLQNQADSTVGQDQALDTSERAELRDILVSSGHTVSEGDLVQVDGFLVGKPHPNTGESVNCNLTSAADNDFHIPLADDADKSPFEGIVVEMIPQNRPATWTIKNLSKAENARRMVRVTGQLFYDNKHRVNPDQDEPESGQPPRFSLFEVHPIVSFSVCKQADVTCAATDWEPLETFAAEGKP